METTALKACFWRLSLLFVLSPICLAVSPADSLYQPAQKVLRLGRQAYTSPRDVIVSHHPLMRYLSHGLKGYEVELKLFRTYERLYHELREGRLDMAWLGTVFYSRIPESELDATPVLKPIWRGRQNYRGQLMTRSDSGIQSLQDVVGRSVAFVSKSSSSGYLFPLKLLNENGIQLSSLGSVQFLGKHTNVVWSVLMREADVGASYAGILENSEFASNREQFRVLARTAPIPNEPLVLKNEWIDEPGPDIVRLLSHPDVSEAVQSIRGLDGFYPVTDADYEPVRQMLR